MLMVYSYVLGLSTPTRELLEEDENNSLPFKYPISLSTVCLCSKLSFSNKSGSNS